MQNYDSESFHDMSIGERIIELRKQQNMSQGQLAEAMEVTRQAVSKWETDKTSPDAQNLIRLTEILDTDIEYLTTGRRSFGRRPPVVINTVETIEKVVEKPVVQVIEKVIEKTVEKPVIEYVEKPVVKKVYRKQYVRNPVEFALFGVICFLFGILVGFLF